MVSLFTVTICQQLPRIAKRNYCSINCGAMIVTFAVLSDVAAAVGFGQNSTSSGDSGEFIVACGAFGELRVLDATTFVSLGAVNDDARFDNVYAIDVLSSGAVGALGVGSPPEYRVYDTTGARVNLIRDKKLGNDPLQVKHEAADKLFVATQDASLGVSVFHQNGTFVRKFGSARYSSLALLPNNMLWAAGFRLFGQVHIFNLSAPLESVEPLASFETLPLQNDLQGMHVDSATSTVLTISLAGIVVERSISDGSVVRQFAPSGSPGLSHYGITRGPNREVFATIAGANLLVRWRANGTFLGIFAGGSLLDCTPLAIVFTRANGRSSSSVLAPTATTTTTKTNNSNSSSIVASTSFATSTATASNATFSSSLAIRQISSLLVTTATTSSSQNVSVATAMHKNVSRTPLLVNRNASVANESGLNVSNDTLVWTVLGFAALFCTIGTISLLLVAVRALRKRRRQQRMNNQPDGTDDDSDAYENFKEDDNDISMHSAGGLSVNTRAFLRRKGKPIGVVVQSSDGQQYHKCPICENAYPSDRDLQVSFFWSSQMKLLILSLFVFLLLLLLL